MSRPAAAEAGNDPLWDKTGSTEFGADQSDDPSATPERDPEKSIDRKSPSGDIPDGGLSAWLVVLGAWCVSFCSFGWLNSVGVFQEYYQNDLLRSYSPSTISWIPSMEIFLMFAMGPFVGIFYDHYGPRWLMLVGTFLHVFGIMMASLSTEYYQILLAQGLCSGIGTSTVFQPSLNAVSGWFTGKRGTAFGILFTGSSIGGIVFPIMVSNLIREVGYAWAMRVCAFLILFFLIIANLTIRTFRPPSAQRVTRAQLAKPWTEAEFVLIMASFFCFSYGVFVPINYLPAQALAAGMDSNLAKYMLPIMNAGSMFGRLSSGIVADRVGRFNVFIVVCFLSGLWILALWIPSTGDASLIAFSVLFGFFSGAFFSLITPVVMQISPMSEIGFRTGMVYFVCAIGGLTTNPINGAIIDSASGYTGLKIFSGVFCIAGTAFVVAARIHHTGWNLISRF
ncbi:MFS general substrate transporter [Thozetella sp. PMI_491]|nr:MFS general substrate transporter [Thozetella sp. PMI_491]